MNGGNSSQQEFLAKITAITEANLHNEQFGVNELARAMGMSRITLHRKITLAAGVSVSQFISQMRLKKAVELLKQNSATVSEVAYQCGFNSPTYFSKCFHDYFGFPPGEAKNQDSHETTEKPETETPKAKPAGKRKWTRVAFAVAIALITTIITSEVFFFRSFTKEKKSAENTIAIIPFVNDSGEEFAPFTTWMGIEIGNKLSKIENMLVVPQSTTETYRDSKKSNRDIAREMMVDHLLRGRTIKTGDKILLNVELLDANNGNAVFTEMYERDLDETEKADLNRIFEICDDVVLQISEVLQTSLTSEEKDQVTKKPTENMAALRTYLEAKHYLDLSGINGHSNVRLAYEQFMKAKKLFLDAVKMDSTFADAYTMLGHIYVNRLPYYANIYHADRYLDTGKIYLVKALNFDEKNFEAASYLRQYYIRKGLLNEADKLLPLTENRVKNYGYYGGKLTEYRQLNDRYHEAEVYLKYLETKPQDLLIMDYITNDAFYNFLYTGFHVRARELNEEILKSARDTTRYLARKADWEITYGSNDSALAIYSQLQKKYPSSTTYLYYKALFCNLNRDYAKALDAAQELEEKILSVSKSVSPDFKVGGFTFLKNGMKEKADYHFKGSIKHAEDQIKLNSINARRYISHFNLALIYAILNDKQKSFQYLEMIKKSPSITLNFINDLKTNPMFDNVRQEPEFQKITHELEKKYLEEHEKIKKLLIRKGLEPA
jgi:AraC-like DNA-binding protein/TolB-like protein